MALGVALLTASFAPIASAQGGSASPPGPNGRADIFFNEACSDCAILVKETLPKILGEFGYTPTKYDYINERDNRKLLNEYNKKWGIPFELQSHIETFIDDNLMIGGHVPESIIRYVMDPAHRGEFGRLVLYQDQMHSSAMSYKVIGSPPGQKDFVGEIVEYSIDAPITDYLKSDQFIAAASAVASGGSSNPTKCGILEARESKDCDINW